MLKVEKTIKIQVNAINNDIILVIIVIYLNKYVNIYEQLSSLYMILYILLSTFFVPIKSIVYERDRCIFIKGWLFSKKEEYLRNLILNK